MQVYLLHDVETKADVETEACADVEYNIDRDRSRYHHIPLIILLHLTFFHFSMMVMTWQNVLLLWVGI
jgi:hypothetical protein